MMNNGLPYAVNILDEEEVTHNFNLISTKRQESYKMVKGGIGYRAVIKCNLKEEGKDVPYEIEFDQIDSLEVSLSSELTSYPVAEGYYISDHMYRSPTTITLRGTYSLYGRQPQTFIGDHSDRLTNVQSIFERIKNQGAFCTITTLNRVDNNSERYLNRNNMVLYNIVWTQNQSSLDFSFSFKEVLVVSVKDISDDWTDIDPDAPNPTDAKLVDFIDEILDWSVLSTIIDDIMINTGRAEPKFIDYVNGKMSSTEYTAYLNEQVENYAVSGTVSGSVGGGTTGATIGILLGALGGPIGMIIGGVAGALMGGTVGGKVGYNQGHSKGEEEIYDDMQYVLTQDDIANSQRRSEYSQFKSNVMKEISLLENAITCWSIPTNEEQEMMLFIGDYYYVFYITRDNANDKWYMDIHWIDGDSEKGILKGSNIPLDSALSDISACKRGENTLFIAEGVDYEVYLFNKKLMNIDLESLSEEESRAIKDDLTNYFIMISATPMDKFNDTLKKLVLNGLKW